MHSRLKIFSFFLITNISLGFSQSFQNGDLDGVVNGYSCLPPFWLNVPIGDPNCIALQSGNDTPDLTSIVGPNPTVGANGNPYSGNTFISGAFGGNAPNFFQEGIMQEVTGFIIGTQYRIQIRQSVVKNWSSLDKSGSWIIYIDTTLADITYPTYSNELFDSNNLIWEARQIIFTATSSTHFIKFLPMDDDTNYTSSFTDTTGALYMGIDSISLSVLTGIYESTSINFKLSPNPNTGSFKLQYNGILNEKTMLHITDVCGKIIDTKEIVNTTTDYENTSLPAGLYFYSLRQRREEVGRGKFLIIK